MTHAVCTASHAADNQVFHLNVIKPDLYEKLSRRVTTRYGANESKSSSILHHMHYFNDNECCLMPKTKCIIRLKCTLQNKTKKNTIKKIISICKCASQLSSFVSLWPRRWLIFFKREMQQVSLRCAISLNGKRNGCKQVWASKFLKQNLKYKVCPVVITCKKIYMGQWGEKLNYRVHLV